MQVPSQHLAGDRRADSQVSLLQLDDLLLPSSPVSSSLKLFLFGRELVELGRSLPRTARPVVGLGWQPAACGPLHFTLDAAGFQFEFRSLQDGHDIARVVLRIDAVPCATRTSRTTPSTDRAKTSRRILAAVLLSLPGRSLRGPAPRSPRPRQRWRPPAWSSTAGGTIQLNIQRTARIKVRKGNRS